MRDSEEHRQARSERAGAPWSWQTPDAGGLLGVLAVGALVIVVMMALTGRFERLRSSYARLSAPTDAGR